MRLEDLPERYQQQVLDTLGPADHKFRRDRSRRVARSKIELRCCTCGYTTRMITHMEAHCDGERHRRYECVLSSYR